MITSHTVETFQWEDTQWSHTVTSRTCMHVHTYTQTQTCKNKKIILKKETTLSLSHTPLRTILSSFLSQTCSSELISHLVVLLVESYSIFVNNYLCKIHSQVWRSSPVGKRTCCSWRWPVFGFQYLNGSLDSSITSLLSHLIPSSSLCWH